MTPRQPLVYDTLLLCTSLSYSCCPIQPHLSSLPIVLWHHNHAPYSSSLPPEDTLSDLLSYTDPLKVYVEVYVYYVKKYWMNWKYHICYGNHYAVIQVRQELQRASSPSVEGG